MTLRALALAVALAVGIYATLAAAWPLVGDAWSRAVAFAADVLIASPGFGARASFTVGKSIDGPTLELALTRHDLPEEAAMSLGMRPRTYMPAVMAMALALATPVNWRRRLLGAALSLLVMGVFILAQAWAAAIDAVARWPNNAMGFPEWGRGPFHFFYLHLCEVPTVAVLAPVLAWAVTILPAFASRPEGGTAADPSEGRPLTPAIGGGARRRNERSTPGGSVATGRKP